MTDERGILVPELRDVIFLIKEYGAVLATGHISPEETRCVVDAARNIGVQKIVVTHPEYWVVDMSLEQQYELVSDYGVVLERCFRQPQKSGAWVSNAARNLAAIRPSLRGKPPCGNISNIWRITASTPRRLPI